jgi:hypothetical protein
MRQCQPNAAIAWRNNDLSIRYVLGLFGPVMVDVWAWRSRVKAESYCTFNLPCSFEPALPTPDLASCDNVSWLTVTATDDETGSMARKLAHVAHDIVHDTVQDQYTWRRPRRHAMRSMR